MRVGGDTVADRSAEARVAAGDVAVIIPHYNDVDRLDRCLSALTAAGLAPNVDAIVVDNGSDEDVRSVVARYPGVRLVVERERGAAAARNRGVRESRAETLAFLDSDCVPAPDWVAAALRARHMADVVGGQVDVFCETPAPRSGAEAFETVFAFNFERYVNRKGFTGTGNMVTRRGVFEHVGPFTNGVSEDLEWCRRATGLGYSLKFVPELVAAHPARADWPSLRRKWLRLTQEAFATHRQSGKGRGLWLARAVAVMLSTVRDAPRVLTTRKLGGPSERGRAALTLFAIRLRRSIWMVQQTLGASLR